MGIGCMFGSHSYEFVVGSMSKTGQPTINWAAKAVPEWQGILKCKICGKEKTEKYIIYGE